MSGDLTYLPLIAPLALRLGGFEIQTVTSLVQGLCSFRDMHDAGEQLKNMNTSSDGVKGVGIIPPHVYMDVPVLYICCVPTVMVQIFRLSRRRISGTVYKGRAFCNV